MRPSLILGRFQPLTANHIAFIRQVLAEGKPVAVCVFDTKKDADNPYSLNERFKMIEQAFGSAVTAYSLPHIAEICYGRDVGYGMRQVELDQELPQISGTAVREHLFGTAMKLAEVLEKPDSFVETFNRLASVQHAAMRLQGFWPEREWASPETSWPNRNDGEAIALIHSELTEVLECLRSGNPPDKDLPEFTGAEVQMADVLGRLMDLSAGRGWRVAEALLAKMEFNKTRPHKHGKEF